MKSQPGTARSAAIVRRSTSAQIFLTMDELAAAGGITPAGLARLIRLGLLEPTTPGGSEFSADTAARLRRMLRLHDDLGVNLAGAAIIVDLLERMERMRG